MQYYVYISNKSIFLVKIDLNIKNIRNAPKSIKIVENASKIKIQRIINIFVAWKASYKTFQKKKNQIHCNPSPSN